VKSLARLAILVAFLSGASAEAKVATQGATGFALIYEAEVAADPKAAYEAFVKIGEWWDGEHSYSGNAKNMSIDVKPGGCWCETLPDGGFIDHMSVAQSIPGKSLMLKGGLGPLAFMGIEGSLVLNFAAKG